MAASPFRPPLCLALFLQCAGAGVLPAASPPAWHAEPVSGQSSLIISDARHRGLSGITWAGTTRFYCASDRMQAIIPLDLLIDPASGVISKGAFSDPLPLKTKSRDFEGIAWISSSRSILYSTESPPGIIRFSESGKPGSGISLPPCYQKPALNKAMESLTWNAAAGRFWTCNEETLPMDAAAVQADGGAVVRLQEFDAKGKSLRQFAWRTSPPTLRIRNTGSGVVDLCLLDDGNLIVMERSISGFQLCFRLFLADFSGAGPLTPAPLTPGSFQPAARQLLHEETTGLTNYEGIALGPVLTDKSRLLILIADSADAPTHQLKPIRLIPGSAPVRPSKTK